MPLKLHIFLKQNKAAGFTLLELMISMVIISMVVSILFGAVRTGFRAWEKGEADIDDTHRLRVARRLIKTQIASMNTQVMFESRDVKEGRAFIPRCTGETVEFVSYRSILPGTDSMVYARYFLDEGETSSIRVFEKPVSVISFNELTAIKDEIDMDDTHVLFEGIESLEIECMRRLEDGSTQWETVWNDNYKNEKEFPMVLRLTFEKDGVNHTISARVRSDHEKTK